MAETRRRRKESTKGREGIEVPERVRSLVSLCLFGSLISGRVFNSVHAKLQECGYTMNDIDRVRRAELLEIRETWGKQITHAKVLTPKGM